MLCIEGKKTIVVGYRPVAIPGVAEILEKPTPPKTMSKADTIKNWEETKAPEIWEKMVYAASMRKVTGRIDEVYAVDPHAKQRFSASAGDDTGESVAVRFLQWIKRYPLQNVLLLGFDIKEFVRVSGVEALLADETVPLNYWYQNESGCADPYDMITEGDGRDSLLLPSVLQLLGIDTAAGWVLHADPKEDARLATIMSLQLGLMDMSGGLPEAFPISTDPVVVETASEQPVPTEAAAGTLAAAQ